MGCMLCDSNNGFLGCFATKMYGMMSVKEAEVYGLREVIN